MRRFLTVALCAIVWVPAVVAGQAPKPVAALSAEERHASSSVRAETVREVTSALSAPEMEGRGTGTPGGERAAKYIADRFAKLGLEPGGDAGTFLQPVPFTATQVLPTTSLSVNGQPLAFGKDFVPSPPFAAEQVDVSGGLVCVGYGVASEALGRDDYAGIDVKDKVAVLLGGRPEKADEAAWTKAGGRQAVIAGLMARGAAAIVYVGLDSPKFGFAKMADYLTRRGVALGVGSAAAAAVPPILLTSSSGAEKLFAASGTTAAEVLAKAKAGEMVSRDLGASATLALRIKRDSVTGSNVVAVLRGSDATLAPQAVLYTAHYDAFGRGLDGTIYPGAADNALGVGEIVAIAEAAAKARPRPRRSLVFLAVCGEEAGLLGARYWAEHPTRPLDAVAANINFDGIGTETYGPVKTIVGFGAEYSSLGGMLEGVAAAMDLTIVPDPVPEERAFYRSDHYALVQKGVPALMLLGAPAGATETWVQRASTWLETDYHQAGDVVRPDWDWGGAQTIAEVGLVVGLRVANAEATPQWLPTSPFKRPAAR